MRRTRAQRPVRLPVRLAAAILLLPWLGAAGAGTGLNPAPPRPGPSGARVKSGTGFVVAPGGFLLTNRHVVAGCAGVAIWPADGGEHRARVVASDRRLDLALLAVEGLPRGAVPARSRGGLQPGEPVLTLGYGLFARQPRKAVLTRGTFVRRGLTAAGTGILIILAPLRPGNSGGAVIDASGALVGMVVGRFAERARLGVVLPDKEIDRFLSAAGLEASSPGSPPPRTADPGALLARISALVQCTGSVR